LPLKLVALTWALVGDQAANQRFGYRHPVDTRNVSGNNDACR
jgi:hypothetical protein